MKKLFLSALLVLACLSACQKNEMSAPVAKGEVLYATIEDVASTRTVKDENNNIRWSEGDQIIAFMNSTLGVKYQVLPSSVGETSASFEEVSTGGLNAGTELEHIVAYYPYSSSVKIARSVNNYTLNAVLPSEQIYAPESFGNGTFPMIAVSSTNNLTFKNICGAMKLQLKGTQKVASIKVEGKNNERLSGAASITAYADGNKPAITMSSDASTSVVLNCGSGIQLNETEATEFIITFPPTLFTKGFVVTISDAAGNRSLIETDKSNEVRRSSVLVMPAVTLENGDIIPQEGDYVDEYGINHGQGIEIDGVVWAPVNCGYHKDDFKYGKLYQWGRNYGQGYSGSLLDVNGTKIGEYSDASVPSVADGTISLLDGQSEINKDIFYRNLSGSYDWQSDHSDKLWNLGTEENPIKTEYDPCPEGWRVPTYTEYIELSQGESYWTEEDDITGRWYSQQNPSAVPPTFKVFLPAAGYRSYDYNAYARGSSGDYWTSTPNLETAFRFHFDMYYKSGMHSYRNTYAYAIRCVQDDDDLIKVERVIINQTQLTLSIDDSESLTATIIPSDANHSYAFWYSDNPEVAVVDQNGNVTAIAEGTANITAMAGMQVATCIVTVTSARVPQEGDYIDEYGINHGQGIEIDGVVWAPVNCGYHATDFKYGKLYQWGRRYGQGYDGGLYDVNGNYLGEVSDALVPEIVAGSVSLATGHSKDNENNFYYNSLSPYDWCTPQNDNLWNSGTEDNPVKTDYDPCPEGWRVPTHAELDDLNDNYSSWTTDKNGQRGYWFSGASSYTEIVPQIFFPSAGYRDDVDGDACDRGNRGCYWSSRPRNRYSYGLLLNSLNVYTTNSLYRANGYSVRCVQE